MKITPIQGTGTPAGTAIGEVKTSQDRIDSAKAVARGEIPMRITPSETPIDPQVERAQLSIRRIKMKTQFSPDRVEQPAIEQNEPVSEVTQNAIPDANAGTTMVEEANQPLSPQFAALAKQKRALQIKERELAEKESALGKSGPNMDEFVSKADLKANPLKIFDLGVSYDDLTQAILSGQSGVNPDIQSLKAEIKALKEGVDKTFTERDSLQEQQVRSVIREEVNNLVATDDTYKNIRHERQQHKVVELIDRIYKAEGKILDESEACDLIEAELLKANLARAEINGVRSLQQAQQVAASKQIRQPIRTLTNRDGAASTPMGRRERMLAAFNGTLRK